MGTFTVGQKVKVYGFGMVEDESQIIGLFAGEVGTIEDMESEEGMVDVKLDESDDSVRVHLVQLFPAEDLF